MPTVLTPRAKHDFVLQDVNADFVPTELLKIQSKKATGLDGLPALLIKDAACIIDKPISHLINYLTFSTSVIPTDSWKEAKVTPIYKSGKKNDVNN